jgi:hypothetical protein
MDDRDWRGVPSNAPRRLARWPVFQREPELAEIRDCLNDFGACNVGRPSDIGRPALIGEKPAARFL